MNPIEGISEAIKGLRRGHQLWDWLLRTYATNIQIEQALSIVRDLRQKPGQVETEYATRMLTALARCGDIHSPYERITLFIEGLLPAIKPLGLQERENRP